MTSTTNTPSLSTLTYFTSQRPVFTRQEKVSAPSSGCSNVGLSSGTDSTVSEEDEDEDTIVRWGWVWYKGEMRRISELPPAEPPKPSPPKQKYDFKPVFSIPSSSTQKRNATVKAAPVDGYCGNRTPDRTSQTLHRSHNLDIHPSSSSPIYVRKPSFASKPLVEVSQDDIFDSDSDLDCDFEFEADFADDELENGEEDDDDCDTLDPSSMARYICDFLDSMLDSDEEDFE